MGHADDDLRIRQAILRLESALERTPGLGHATDSSTTTLIEGVRCRCEAAGYLFDTDLPAGLGGTGTGPTPGVLLRAALGSCLAMGYRLRAARHGIALRSVRVVVETESEVEGMLVADSATRPGFVQLRYDVEIETDAPRHEVETIVDEADRLSPMLDAVGGTSHMRRSLSITAGAG